MEPRPAADTVRRLYARPIRPLFPVLPWVILTLSCLTGLLTAPWRLQEHQSQVQDPSPGLAGRAVGYVGAT